MSTEERPQIRPEILALCSRGNITFEEFEQLYCTTPEWEMVFANLNDDALVLVTKLALANCNAAKPHTTYNDHVVGVLAPELVRRLESRR